jgi:hypothetical protein
MQTHNSCMVDEDSCEQRLLPHAEAKMQHIEQNLEKLFGTDISQDLQRFWNVAADKQTLQRLYSNRQHEDVRQFMTAITDCLSVRELSCELCLRLSLCSSESFCWHLKFTFTFSGGSTRGGALYYTGRKAERFGAHLRKTVKQIHPK